jgi:hypothetical protein
MSKMIQVFGNMPDIISLVPNEKGELHKYNRDGGSKTVQRILEYLATTGRLTANRNGAITNDDKRMIDLVYNYIDENHHDVDVNCKFENPTKSMEQGTVVRNFKLTFEDGFKIYRTVEVNNVKTKQNTELAVKAATTGVTDIAGDQVTVPTNEQKNATEIEENSEVACCYFNSHDDSNLDADGVGNVFITTLNSIVSRNKNLKTLILGIDGITKHGLLKQLTYIKRTFQNLEIELVVNCDWIREQFSIRISEFLSWESTIQELIFRLHFEKELRETLIFDKANNNTKLIHSLSVLFGLDGGIHLNSENLDKLISNDLSDVECDLSLDLHHIEGHISTIVENQKIGNMPTILASLAYYCNSNSNKKTSLPHGMHHGLLAARFSTLFGFTSDGFPCSTAGEPTQPYLSIAEIIKNANVNFTTWLEQVDNAETRKLVILREKRVTNCYDIASNSFKQFPASIPVLNSEPTVGFFSNPYFRFLPMDKNRAFELAKKILVEGTSALDINNIPTAKFGDLLLCTRSEIESFREFFSTIQNHEKLGFSSDLKTNFCVVSEPGAGKSFAIKEVIKCIPSKVIDCNFPARDISQFVNEDDMVRSFKMIAERGAQGKVPVVFWDEYDSHRGNQPFGWLQGLLEPTNSRNHASGALGRAIFIFAGSRFKRKSDVFECESLEFNNHLYSDYILESEIKEHGYNIDSFTKIDKILAKWSIGKKYFTLRHDKRQKYQDFVSGKGLDFKRRMQSFIEISGVNQSGTKSDDFSFLYKRAQVARHIFGKTSKHCFTDKKLNICDKAVEALLNPDVKFVHGASSFESICSLMRTTGSTRISPSCFPSGNVLEAHIRNPHVFEGPYRKKLDP